MTTSKCGSTRRSNPRPSSDFRLSVMNRLLRAYTFHQNGCPSAVHCRNGSPAPGCSTFTTSAPKSARSIPATPPATMRERSRTRTPSSAFMRSSAGDISSERPAMVYLFCQSYKLSKALTGAGHDLPSAQQPVVKVRRPQCDAGLFHGLLQQTALGQRVRVEGDVALQQRDVLRLRHFELPCTVVGPQHVHGFGNAGHIDVVLLIQLHWTGETGGFEVREHPFEVDHAVAAWDHFRRPRRAGRSIRRWPATTSSRWSSSRTAALDPPEIFDREPVNELVRNVTRLDPASATANRRVTEVVIQPDTLRIEILDRNPQ